MKVKINPSRAVGRISAPPSKSMAHRLLICAALAQGESIVRGVSDCDDVRATIDCLTALGARFEYENGNVRVHGTEIMTAAPREALACRESGSTFRFLVPLAWLSGKNVIMTGAPSLLARPMSVYSKLAKEKDLVFSQDKTSVVLRGPLRSGKYIIAGDISSQFVSGLLFSLPLLDGDSEIELTPPVVSRPYIDMTVASLAEFGVNVRFEGDHKIKIAGGQKYMPRVTEVEGDYSGASFFSALNTLGGEVEIDGLRRGSLQGDSVCGDYLKMLELGIPTVHIGDCPDLGPVLFAAAAAKHGGIFTGTARLKIKESDRAEAMAAELRKFGTAVQVKGDSVVVYPASLHEPKEELCGHNDHRIVMALSVLCTKTGGVINGAEAVAKSFPDFFLKLTSLGIEIKTYEA